MSDPSEGGGAWTLLTGHGHVLVEIARNPEARIRDISPVVGLADRTVQAIVADLEATGYLTRTRTGRRVRYSVNRDSLFRHSAQEGHQVGPFLDLLTATGTAIIPNQTTTETDLTRTHGLRLRDPRTAFQVRWGNARQATAAEAAPPGQFRRTSWRRALIFR